VLAGVDDREKVTCGVTKPAEAGAMSIEGVGVECDGSNGGDCTRVELSGAGSKGAVVKLPLLLRIALAVEAALRAAPSVLKGGVDCL